MVTQKQLDEMVEAGHYSLTPEFRYPNCANCGEPVNGKIWHVFLKEYGNKREIHLCKSCGVKYDL